MITEYVIKPGFGYWDTTNYPYGGCFRRTAKPLADGSIKEIEGKAADGRTICVARCSCVTAVEVGGVFA